MSDPVYFTLDGREYVLLSRADYERIAALARVAALPPVSAGKSSSKTTAAQFATDSIGREILLRRTKIGLTQSDLSKLAGVRLETICRLERGRNIPSTGTVAMLDRALVKAELKAGHKHT